MVEIINDLRLSEPYFEAVRRVSGNYSRTGYLSATSVSQPPQIGILERRHDDKIIVPVSRLLPAFIGTVLHGEIELSECEKYIQEQELVIDVDGVPFSGRPDVIFDNRRIGDYKFTSVWGWLYGIKDDYLIQAHMNSYLARQHGHPITSAWIEMTFLDWSKSKAKFDSKYPPRVGMHLIDELWPDEQADTYIRERIAIHKAAEALPDEELPECSPEDRWQKPTQFAVKKKGAKRAVRNGLCDSMDDAVKLVSKLGRGHDIEVREGVTTRCDDWCNAAQVCQQLKREREGLS